jgi:hypothetical protein
MGKSNCIALPISVCSRAAILAQELESAFGSDSLCGAFHRFGGHIQTGEIFQQLAAMLEGTVLTHNCLHAAHAWRAAAIFDVEFYIRRELARMAVRAQKVGAR